MWLREATVILSHQQWCPLRRAVWGVGIRFCPYIGFCSLSATSQRNCKLFFKGLPLFSLLASYREQHKASYKQFSFAPSFAISTNYTLRQVLKLIYGRMINIHLWKDLIVSFFICGEFHQRILLYCLLVSFFERNFIGSVMIAAGRRIRKQGALRCLL